MVILYSAMAKADSPDDGQVDIDFSDLLPDMADQLSGIAKEGVWAGAAQITLTETDGKLANERAEDWAEN